MFKRIGILVLMIQFLLFGSFTAWAEASQAAEDLLSVEQTEETQQIDVHVEQNQQVNTGGTAEKIEQEQEVTVEQSQEHATPIEEETSEWNEDQAPLQVVDEETVEQEESSEANQTPVEESGEPNKNESDLPLEEDTEPETEESYSQEQTIEIIAEQQQIVTEADRVEADQEQDVAVEYSQSLKVTQKDSQSQETKIITNQDQSFQTNDQTDYVEQNVGTEIDTKQEGEIHPEENLNKAEQETTVTTIQTHHSEMSGSATIEQKQSMEATASYNDTKSDHIRIQAKTANGLEIIKDAAQTVVKMIQSIVINNQEVEKFEKEWIVGNQEMDQKQEYHQAYYWGTLHVLNNIHVHETEDDDLYSFLDSIIRLEFSLPKPLPEVNNDDDYNPDYDQDGLTNDEERELGTDPNNPDTDGDRLSDYWEVKRFQTDPLNVDSDGDGLTDYIEIVYHAPTTLHLKMKESPKWPYLRAVSLSTDFDE
ncbi:hypothetical protein [Niallia endozanthoxylica]|uniref:Uncharacterized protein n=1 Tax=Niallia endozanthoxylica TaxID=2036016 RepID=A0A5J5HK08_9BACI|nr:hypothetical protein [Niallia endozanthoxylica]KAA9021119.1 hypothetical protein F4V44_18495 [Niallia endozanthoxylica]